MASTGEIEFTSAETINESPWLDEPWVNPTNALTDNGQYASVTAATFDTGDQTAVLKVYGANVALAAALPSDLVSIDGVIVRINGYSDSATLVDFDLVQLLDTARAKGGTNQAATTVQMGTDTAAIHTFGGATDKWGRALDRAWCIDPDFGVAIGVLSQTNNSQAFIDRVTIEVFYTPASVATGVAQLSLGSGDTPTVNTGHKIRVRARVTSGSGTIRAALYEGTNNRSGDLESATLTTSFTTYDLAISEANAANITDYSNLEIRLWGYAASGIVFEVAEASLIIPAGEASTPKAGTDSGSGTQGTTVLTTSISGTDSRPPGTDSSALSAVLSSTADTGTSTEAAIIAVPVSGNDSGSGSESSSLTAQVSTSDTGSGTDSSALTASYSFTDTGTGAEGTSVLSAVFSAIDSGTSTEASSVQQTFSVSGIDSGSGTDISSVLHTVAGADTGTGVEESTLSSVATSTDTGTAAESGTTQTETEKFGTDTGVGIDTGALTYLASSSDVGVGTDSSSLTTPAEEKEGTDTGTSTDFSLVTVGHAGSDTGIGDETTQQIVTLAVVEAPLGSDTSYIIALVSSGDVNALTVEIVSVNLGTPWNEMSGVVNRSSGHSTGTLSSSRITATIERD